MASLGAHYFLMERLKERLLERFFKSRSSNGSKAGFIRCFMMIYWPPHATLHSFWHSRGWSGLYRVIKAVIPSAAMVVIAYRMRCRGDVLPPPPMREHGCRYMPSSVVMVLEFHSEAGEFH